MKQLFAVRLTKESNTPVVCTPTTKVINDENWKTYEVEFPIAIKSTIQEVIKSTLQTGVNVYGIVIKEIK